MLLFTEGKAFTTLEFDSAPDDPVPPDGVIDLGQKQDTAIERPTRVATLQLTATESAAFLLRPPFASHPEMLSSLSANGRLQDRRRAVHRLKRPRGGGHRLGRLGAGFCTRGR